MPRDLAEKPLAIYNMWPRNYSEHEEGAFAAMTADLERVKELGFNTVYVNPFYEVGKRPKDDQLFVGSLYANSDLGKTNPSLFQGKSEAFFADDGQLTESGEQIQTFCAEVRKQGMLPMFDLVQSHLSPDSPHVQKAKELGISLLKTYPNGSLAIHNLKEDYAAQNDPDTRIEHKGKDIWDDVVTLNYDDPAAKDYIINEILIPYVEQMAELGFRGVHIDSSPQTPKEVHDRVCAAFTQKVAALGEPNFTPPVIGETLNNVKSMGQELRDAGTHSYSSAYFHPKELDFDIETLFNIPDIQHKGQHWLKSELWEKAHAALTGVVMPVSTNDEERLHTRLKELYSSKIDRLIELNKSALGEDSKDLGIITEALRDVRQKKFDDPEFLGRLARIKIAWSALFSNGGYLMASGDEFLVEEEEIEKANDRVFDGRIVSNSERHAHPYYDAIMEKAEDTEIGESFAFNGKLYEVREGYTKPVWYEGALDQKSQRIVVELIRQPQIKNLVVSRKQESMQHRNLSSFISQVNEAVKGRKKVDINHYSDVYFSKENPDIICITGHIGGNNKLQHEHKLHEAFIINVSGKQQEITEEIWKDFIEQTHIAENTLKNTAVLVGDFPEKAKGVVLNG